MRKNYLDFSKIKTYSIEERAHKESATKFPNLEDKIKIFQDKNLEKLAKSIIKAKKNKNKITFMMGGHVVKTGMSKYIVDLMKKGYVNHIAMNGSTSIHDFEIAYLGETSEDVEKGIKNGSFGMVEETGKKMNDAINDAAKKNLGYGHAIGELIGNLNSKNKENSLLYQAYKNNIPATVHVAIGNDTIHQHPSCNGESIGKTSYLDFKTFTKTLSQSKEGVIVNIGSAVILPETFLKAVTVARNLDFPLEKITTANLDMIDHYRPKVNVVERPTKALGGEGLTILGKHEKTIPSLYKLILKNDK
jgi:deoxyhypusine synthase